ncbi:gas vesicle accessory protein GvpU [Oceanobacillus alkalisoli]|uniref:gas vesicle accessory protein GvpU n=1 Tax=Oceanobacillus alkalisoli TaxID=2925113 RepID=UPI001EE46605|nr:gas vesicle accessory protein GvpU [Oceanobacillus alkalisoli]MCG5104461.1 hypothetical protein [Oceanobacillus alkalisoli]
MSNEEQEINLKQDWYLENLVYVANAGVEIGITLSIKGTIVSGTLIPNYRYFEILSEQFNALGNELGKSLSGAADKYVDEFRQDKNKDLDEIQVGYIHLNDAKYYTPNGNFPQDSMLWRGKIEEVDGFTIGSLSERTNRG